jgi:hypothetical protein
MTQPDRPSRMRIALVLGVILSSMTSACVFAQAPAAAPSSIVKLPLKAGSVRWVVIGDNGTGDQAEQEVANQMERFRQLVKYDFVTMDGDNIYGGHKPADFQSKFEQPYKALLSANVKFYATIGNHDDPDIERKYKLFNMDGNRYYTFVKGDVEFFVLDSNYMDPTQLAWVDDKLKNSKARWKICYFHHPMFTSAKFHGPSVDLRQQLMPLFAKYNVNVVLAGHEHVYERIKPQNGIYLFVLGNSGQLRVNNIRKPNDLDIVGIDTDRTFMLMEISGDQLFYQTVTGSGNTVDSGVLERQGAAKP